MSIAVQTSKANRLRAAIAADPSADPLRVAASLGLERAEAKAALRRKLARRIKTTAK